MSIDCHNPSAFLICYFAVRLLTVDVDNCLPTFPADPPRFGQILPLSTIKRTVATLGKLATVL